MDQQLPPLTLADYDRLIALNLDDLADDLPVDGAQALAG
jgi:hypothetical protein